MTDVSIEEIKKMVSLQLGAREVSENSLLIEDLGAESADVANLVAALEEKYRITVRESEIAKVRTPADLLELVREHLSLRGL
ncbi:MAG: acyl carrier protein [Anaerolineales bacterium]|nr:acyl carrier protein [Anaerolineae bacterium]PWB70693.1 MAG: acyl carrier protein [Anaerolineales bacterium]